MGLYDLYFWQNWTVSRQRRLFLLLLAGWAMILYLVWYGVAMSGESSVDKAKRFERSYNRAAPLVAQYLAFENTRGALAAMGPMAAAQQVARDLGLEGRLSSVRPMELDGGSQGVQMIFDGLDLPQILGLLKDLDERGGLKTVSFALNHRLDNDQLANLQMVLTR